MLIVGEPGAGKKDVATNTDICVPFKSMGFSLGKKVDMDKKINYKLTLIFWTLTKGRPRETTYLNGAGAAIIVGNLKSRNVIKKMDDWADLIIGNVGWIPIFFIGKIKEHSNENIDKKLKKLAMGYNSTYFLYSPFEENAIKRIFNKIAKELADKYYRIMMRKNYSKQSS